jgi:hypothetical protein
VEEQSATAKKSSQGVLDMIYYCPKERARKSREEQMLV